MNKYQFQDPKLQFCADKVRSLLKLTRKTIEMEVGEIYEDDHLLCSDSIINGVPIQFGWYDSLGFLEYWEDSKKAWKDLKTEIESQVEMILDSMEREESYALEDKRPLNLDDTDYAQEIWCAFHPEDKI